MNNAIIYQSVKWILILLLQVVILDQIELNRFISPYVYISFILFLPLETPIWAVLLIGFGAGFMMDIFSNSLGLHAAATVLMSYIRGGIISLKKPSIDYAEDQQPDLADMGLRWFSVYALISISVHHFCYFFLEIFNFSYMPYILFKTVCSTAVSLTLILLGRYLFFQRH